MSGGSWWINASREELAEGSKRLAVAGGLRPDGKVPHHWSHGPSAAIGGWPKHNKRKGQSVQAKGRPTIYEKKLK